MDIITKKWQSKGTGTVTIAAPGKAGQYLVLTSLDITGDAAANIEVSSPSATSVFHSELFAGGGGFTKVWTVETGIRGAENQAIVITVSAGNYNITVTGVTVG